MFLAQLNVAKTTATTPRRQPSTRELMRVSRYDAVASWVVALIFLLGFVVALMLVVWLTKTTLYRPKAFAVTMIRPGTGERAGGYAQDIEPPGLEDAAVLLEPQIENMLEAVTDAVSSVEGVLDSLETGAAVSARGKGLGDSRFKGTGGDGGVGTVLPPWQRWRIRFESSSIEAYARQLDFFGIELAAVGGSNEIDYATALATSRPQHRQAESSQEKRLYMTWSSGALQAYDEQLLQQAGVATQGRIVLQFFPPPVEEQLLGLELAAAGGRSVAEIQRTFFGVRSVGAGYEFFVTDQEFRPF